MRRRQQLRPDTFPFLAVLLCTMGSLILVLMVFDRKARLAARARAEAAWRKEEEAEAGKAAALAAADEEQRLARQRAQLTRLAAEERRLHIDHDRVRARLAAVLQALEEPADVFTIRKKQAAGRTAQARQDFLLRQAELTRATRAADGLRTERQRLTDELLALEASLRRLRAQRQREQQTWSVVPYVGRRGQNVRPHYVECTSDGLVFHPDRRTLTGIYLSPESVRDEVRKRTERPSRTGPQPYWMLLVRPDGIGSYYVFLSAVKPLDLSYGYEFVDPDWVLDFPDPSRAPRPPVPLATVKPPPRPRRPLGVIARGASLPGQGRGSRLPSTSPITIASTSGSRGPGGPGGAGGVPGASPGTTAAGSIGGPPAPPGVSGVYGGPGGGSGLPGVGVPGQSGTGGWPGGASTEGGLPGGNAAGYGPAGGATAGQGRQGIGSPTGTGQGNNQPGGAGSGPAGMPGSGGSGGTGAGSAGMSGSGSPGGTGSGPAGMFGSGPPGGTGSGPAGSPGTGSGGGTGSGREGTAETLIPGNSSGVGLGNPTSTSMFPSDPEAGGSEYPLASGSMGGGEGTAAGPGAGPGSGGGVMSGTGGEGGNGDGTGSGGPGGSGTAAAQLLPPRAPSLPALFPSPGGGQESGTGGATPPGAEGGTGAASSGAGGTGSGGTGPQGGSPGGAGGMGGVGGSAGAAVGPQDGTGGPPDPLGGGLGTPGTGGVRGGVYGPGGTGQRGGPGPGRAPGEEEPRPPGPLPPEKAVAQGLPQLSAGAAPGGEPAGDGDGFRSPHANGLPTPPPDTRRPRRPRPRPRALRPAARYGDGEWVLVVDCTARGVRLSPSQVSISLQELARGRGGDALLARTVANMLERRRAMQDPAAPPFRPQIRFVIHKDGLRSFHAALPPLEGIRVPKSTVMLDE